MKKVLFVFLVSAFSVSAIFAQKASEEMLTFDKQQCSGFSIIIPNLGKDVVESALKERFEKVHGLKSEKQFGYKVYLNQQFPAFGTASFDIYVKILETGKKDTKTTAIQLIVSKGNLNVITQSSDLEVYNKVMEFLNGFPNYAAEYDANQKVILNTNILTKLNKERDDLSAEKEKLQKQINDIDLKITNKESDIKKAQEALDAAKAVIKK